MGEFILNVMENWGYIGIGFLICLENIFPPIPSEVILTFGGFLTNYSSLTPWGVIFWATLGSLVGAIILYYLGYFLSTKLSKLFKNADLSKTNAWFSKKGQLSVLYCRCIPIVRSLVSIPAGTSKMYMPLFLYYTTIGSVIWNTILVYAGAFLGDNWPIVAQILSRYSKLILIIIILFIVLKIYIKRKKRIV